MDAWDELSAKYSAPVKSDNPSKDPWDELAAKYSQPRYAATETQRTPNPKPIAIGKDAFPDTLRETLANTDWATRNIAGAGTAATNLYYGGKQLLGSIYDSFRSPKLSELITGKQPTWNDKEEIANNKIIEKSAPVGSFLGNVAVASVPFGMAGTGVTAAGAVGAGMGALNPVENANTTADIAKGKAFDTALGGGLGAAGQGLANAGGKWLNGVISKQAEKQAAKQAINRPIDDTVREAIDAGFVIPPGNINPSWINRQLESIGGKIATQQVFSNKNSAVADRLARIDAGLAENMPITPETLKAARQTIQKPYQEISGLIGQGPLDALDAARAEARSAWKEYSRQGTRSALNDYKQFSGQAKQIESSIEDAITNASSKQADDLLTQANQLTQMAGQQYANFVTYANKAKSLHEGSAPAWSQNKINDLLQRARESQSAVSELQAKAVNLRKQANELYGQDNSGYANGLINKFREARANLAKNHDVENALIEGGGSVDPRYFAKKLQSGQKLTGNLETIGKFGNNFKRLVQPPNTIGTPDATNLTYGLSLLLGSGGALVGEDPKYAALGLIPMLSRPAARSILMRNAAQQALANPNYSTAIAPRMASGLLQYAPVGATALGLPAFGK